MPQGFADNFWNSAAQSVPRGMEIGAQAALRRMAEKIQNRFTDKQNLLDKELKKSEDDKRKVGVTNKYQSLMTRIKADPYLDPDTKNQLGSFIIGVPNDEAVTQLEDAYNAAATQKQVEKKQLADLERAKIDKNVTNEERFFIALDKQDRGETLTSADKFVLEQYPKSQQPKPEKTPESEKPMSGSKLMQEGINDYRDAIKRSEINPEEVSVEDYLFRGYTVEDVKYPAWMKTFGKYQNPEAADSIMTAHAKEYEDIRQEDTGGTTWVNEQPRIDTAMAKPAAAGGGLQAAGLPQPNEPTPEEQKLLNTPNEQLSDADLDRKAELIKRLMAQGK